MPRGERKNETRNKRREDTGDLLMKIHILETGYKDKRMSGDQKRETRG